jgi:hypothetical protein
MFTRWARLIRNPPIGQQAGRNQQRRTWVEAKSPKIPAAARKARWRRCGKPLFVSGPPAPDETKTKAARSFPPCSRSPRFSANRESWPLSCPASHCVKPNAELLTTRAAGEVSLQADPFPGPARCFSVHLFQTTSNAARQQGISHVHVQQTLWQIEAVQPHAPLAPVTWHRGICPPTEFLHPEGALRSGIRPAHIEQRSFMRGSQSPGVYHEIVEEASPPARHRPIVGLNKTSFIFFRNR